MSNQYTSETIQDKFIRFWSHVAITGDDNLCWLWVGNRFKNGYGFQKINHKRIRAHRIAWSYPDYVIPDGMFICHSCDTPLCCNPKHLFLGTNQDNLDDMRNKGRGYLFPVRRGEDNYSSKLNSYQVGLIRSRYLSGSITQTALAKEYGVSQAAISLILTGKKWNK
jgi:hypothetical protein